MTVGSEVQEIRGWGKQSGELRQGRCQSPAEGAEQVPSAQRWGCQVVPGEVWSPPATGPARLLLPPPCSAVHPQSTALAEGTGDITGRCAGTSGGCLDGDGGKGRRARPGPTAGRMRQMLLCQSSPCPPFPAQWPFPRACHSRGDVLPLLPEQTLSPTAPVAVRGKMRIIRRRCLLLQVSLKAWQSPTPGSPLISAFETL